MNILRIGVNAPLPWATVLYITHAYGIEVPSETTIAR